MLSLPYSLPLPHTHTLLSPLSLLLFRSSLLSSLTLFRRSPVHTNNHSRPSRNKPRQPPLSNPLVNARRQHSRQRSDPLGERGCRDVCVVGVCMCVCVPLGVCVGILVQMAQLCGTSYRSEQLSPVPARKMLFLGFIIGLFACPPLTQAPLHPPNNHTGARTKEARTRHVIRSGGSGGQRLCSMSVSLVPCWHDWQSFLRACCGSRQASASARMHDCSAHDTFHHARIRLRERA